jgi:hypothetical protein
MKIREIKFSDVFALARILKKINAKKIISENMNTVDIQNLKENEAEEIIKAKGLEIVLTLIQEAGDAEKEVCAFIGSFTDKEDVPDWKLKDIKEFIDEFMKVNSIEEIKGLFIQAMN